MQGDLEKERLPMKPVKIAIDESKLSPPQRKALEIAKAQGVPFSRRLEELIQDVEPDEVDKITDSIMALRREGRKSPPRNPFNK